MTLDLTTWRARRIDEDDEYAVLEWVGLDAFWDRTPTEEIGDLTWGEFEGYYARARAITAIAYALILNLPEPDRPYLSQVYIDLRDEGGPSLSAMMPLKRFRDCVAEAVELVDSRKVDAEARIVEDVIEGREETQRNRWVIDRAHRLTSQDEHLLSFVWANLYPLSYEKKMAWLDRFEVELIGVKARAAAGIPEETGPLMAEAEQFQQDAASA